MEFNVTKSTVECYKIKQSDGFLWADINIDSNGKAGRIQIASDYGNWQYYWGAGTNPFKKFLTELDMYYVAGKFGCDRWFDSERTIKAYRESIIENRRNESIDAELARHAWNETIALETEVGDNSNEFASYIWSECNGLTQLYETPMLCNSVHPLFVRFWNEIWPVLMEEFKKELSLP